MVGCTCVLDTVNAIIYMYVHVCTRTHFTQSTHQTYFFIFTMAPPLPALTCTLSYSILHGVHVCTQCK